MNENPFAAPEYGVDHASSHPDELAECEYAGFWYRVLASIVDNILISIALFPIGLMVAGWTILVPDKDPTHGMPTAQLVWQITSWFLTAAIILVFWFLKSATPGKMILKMRIVDATTLGKPSFGRFLIRYLGYIPAILSLGLGLLWVAWDARKQGWHDKLGNTLVVRPSSKKPIPAPETAAPAAAP